MESAYTSLSENPLGRRTISSSVSRAVCSYVMSIAIWAIVMVDDECKQSDTPSKTGGLMSRTASKTLSSWKRSKIVRLCRPLLGRGDPPELALAHHPCRHRMPACPTVCACTVAALPQTDGRWPWRSCLGDRPSPTPLRAWAVSHNTSVDRIRHHQGPGVLD
jgi:hypothetical protein